MDYIVAYTLKHRTEDDTFNDNWIVYKDGEWPNTKKSAIDSYNAIIEQDGGTEWYVWTAYVSVVIKSTD